MWTNSFKNIIRVGRWMPVWVLLAGCGNDPGDTPGDTSDTDGDSETETASEEDDGTWPSTLIDGTFASASGLLARDLDGDGDADFVGSAGGATSDMVWWRNDGGEPLEWTKQVIDGNFSVAMHATAADVDGDGNVDVLGAAWSGNEIAWWRSDGGDPIEWTKQTIVSDYLAAHEVYACDLDGDGDTDVLGASAENHLISWWRNDGGSPITWTEQTIGAKFGGARSVVAADFDGDEDMDVAGAALLDNTVTWWRNDGGSPITWTEIPLDNDFAGAHAVAVFDINGDSRPDILAAAYIANEIAWWENNGDAPLTFTKHTIDNTVPDAMMARADDLDGDGDLDVFGTARATSMVFWWENDGGTPIKWTRNTLANNISGPWPVDSADFDGDGDKDIVAASEGGSALYWYENQL